MSGNKGYLVANNHHLFGNKGLVRDQDSGRGKETCSGINELFGDQATCPERSTCSLYSE